MSFENILKIIYNILNEIDLIVYLVFFILLTFFKKYDIIYIEIKKGFNKMRLWHKDLIPALPREQLVAQWRECSAIAGAILKNGIPNHILVNKVLDYPMSHFVEYAIKVRQEMTQRGYRTMDSVMKKIALVNEGGLTFPADSALYDDWHNERYFLQCYYNLQEKYDCGGITPTDWEKIYQIGVSKFGIGEL